MQRAGWRKAGVQNGTLSAIGRQQMTHKGLHIDHQSELVFVAVFTAVAASWMERRRAWNGTQGRGLSQIQAGRHQTVL